MSQNSPTDIRVMLDIVDRGYRFEVGTYPELDTTDPYKFGVNHSALHMMKSVGVIAGEVEAFEHGKGMNHDTLVLATNKMLANVLKLAAHIGVSGTQLAEYIDETYTERMK